MQPPPPCRPWRVLVIDADRHAASHTAEVLFGCGHWARCATSAAAVMRAVRAYHFDVLMVNTTSFANDADLLLRQVRTLYPIAAVELAEHAHWFEKHRAENENFEYSVRNPVTPARLAKALKQLAERLAGTLPLDDAHDGFADHS